MKLLFPLLFSFLLVSCYFWKTPKTLRPEPYPLESEIDLYLSTEDPDVEKQVITRLKQHKTLNEEVKKVLRKRPHETRLTSGLQLKLKIKYNGKNYPYALFIPSATKPETTFPLIIILHGMGSTGDSIIQKWVQRLQDEFIVLCPSYPMGAWWARPAEEIVLQLIQKAKSEYPVDQNRIFLAGLSNGAIGTFTIGMFYPDYFAGIVPIAGSINKRLMHFLVNLNNTPIYLIHGNKDPVFPVSYQQRVYKILSDLKYSVVYREHHEAGMAHGGHFLPEKEVPPLVKWLLRQKRRLEPKVVRMTREGNHMEAIHWARITKGINLAALQIPGPERESMNIRNGKIATMFAIQKGDNLIEVMGRNLLDYEIYLNSDMINFNIPVRITTREIIDQGNRLVPGEVRVSFEHKVKPSLLTLLQGFKIRRDPHLLFDAVVRVSLGENIARVWQP